MKRFFTILAGLTLFFSLSVKADEGMWLLNLLDKLNMEELKEMGLELSAEEIYSINHSSLKDAIGALDHGSCTAEIVSPEGLLLTNHHCGYEEIQNHSSVEHDYLKKGFWAMTKDEELPNPGKTMTFIVKIEDVTDQIFPNLTNDLTDDARAQKVRELSADIINNATEGTHYEAVVRSFFKGNKYFLVVSETYSDVRLVGAPPESIGNFGDDSDNWMWPRHTGDFSIFRVYTGPDGLPADYSPDNIPLKPKHFLPVSLKGYQENDFAMILGFPGTTNRYYTSYEINEVLDIDNPARIKIRAAKQEIILADMMASDAVRIQYSSKYSHSTNYYKYSIGQSQGLRNLNVVERKTDTENAFKEWANANTDRKAKYGNVLDMIEKGVNGRKAAHKANIYMFEAMYLSIETVQPGMQFNPFLDALSKDDVDEERIKFIQERYKTYFEENFFKDYHAPTDKKVTKAMLELIFNDVDNTYLDPNLLKIKAKYAGKLDKFVDQLFNKSIFTNKERFLAFLDKPSAKVLEKDLGFNLANSFLASYEMQNSMMNEYNDMVEEGTRLFLAGQMEMNPDKFFYPDANSTMRMTFGTVGGYSPKDAVHYDYYTTPRGIFEKEIPNDFEFDVDPKLKELLNKKDFAPYFKDGNMKICFTTNNDITGGNSGSGVINGKGELIGLAFDGNWEAMSGDIAFEPVLQKCINVDIRYVLFVIDKFAGAKHLVDEMTLVE
jgi:Peptidase S46